jgi:hypothetical protein
VIFRASAIISGTIRRPQYDAHTAGMSETRNIILVVEKSVGKGELEDAE